MNSTDRHRNDSGWLNLFDRCCADEEGEGKGLWKKIDGPKQMLASTEGSSHLHEEVEAAHDLSHSELVNPGNCLFRIRCVSRGEKQPFTK